MLDLDVLNIDVPCPVCGYELESSIRDIRMEGRQYCPNCKATILLRDEDASVELGNRAINRAMEQLDRSFRSLGG